MTVLSLALLPGILAALVAVSSTRLVIRFAWKYGLIDDPKKHKHPKIIHTKPTPRGGGLAIYVAIIAASVVFLPLDKHLVGILAGITILTILGLVDDKHDLNPYVRLGVQFLAAAMPIAAGIGIAFINNPIGGGIIDLSHPRLVLDIFGQTKSIWLISDIFALIWIVFLMNMLNMGAKGVDGQLTGTAAIAAIAIALLSLRFSADIAQWPVITLASITAGAFLGFLPWHIYPQKIMPSFSGSNIAGYMLAVLAILATAKVGALIVILGVPLIDTGYTIVRRIVSGKSPVWGDRGHLHHRLIDSGWPKAQVAFFYWLTTALLAALALSLNTTSKLYTIVGVALTIGGTILWLTWRSKLSK